MAAHFAIILKLTARLSFTGKRLNVAPFAVAIAKIQLIPKRAIKATLAIKNVETH